MANTPLIDLSVLPTFLTAVLIILAAPGPDMMFMVASGLKGGTKGATKAAFGITLGVSVYVFLTAIGLAALLNTLPSALLAIKIIGIFYLSYLAFSTWQSSKSAVESVPETSKNKFFFQGFWVNITNPKIAIFFVAFLPQFLGKVNQNPTYQLIMLGLILQLCGLIVDLVIGFTAGKTRDKLLNNEKTKMYLDRLSAIVYGSLGLSLVWESARETIRK